MAMEGRTRRFQGEDLEGLIGLFLRRFAAAQIGAQRLGQARFLLVEGEAAPGADFSDFELSWCSDATTCK
jgi:hypothetical protein